jgi:hypothetical protein
MEQVHRPMSCLSLVGLSLWLDSGGPCATGEEPVEGCVGSETTGHDFLSHAHPTNFT